MSGGNREVASWRRLWSSMSWVGTIVESGKGKGREWGGCEGAAGREWAGRVWVGGG